MLEAVLTSRGVSHMASGALLAAIPTRVSFLGGGSSSSDSHKRCFTFLLASTLTPYHPPMCPGWVCHSPRENQLQNMLKTIYIYIYM
eukprot:c15207_g1_i1 orf=2-259(-)